MVLSCWSQGLRGVHSTADIIQVDMLHSPNAGGLNRLRNGWVESVKRAFCSRRQQAM
jgi:hypothetical protein